MSFSILAEFAGTKDEAREFAKANGLNYARNLGTKPNGFPYVSLNVRLVAGLKDALSKFASLGWDRDSVILHDFNKPRFKRA